MKYNVVNTKNIHSTQRFDPSFHLSDAITLRERVENVPFEKVSIADATENVFLGNIFSRIFVKDAEHGIPYLAASDTVLANLDTGRYLSKKQASALSYLMLKKDWIVVTCSGTIGNVTYTNSSFENHIATHDLIRIVPNDEKNLRGYLYAFLASKYGYNQLTQSQFGGVVKHINAEHVRNIKVPCFAEYFQEEVNDLIQEAARLREEATCALEKAKDKVSKCCNNEFDNLECSQTNIVSVSSIVKSFKTRLDPPVYINKGVAWSKRQKHAKRLGDLNIKIWYPGIFKRAYVKNGLPYIKGSSVFNVNPFKSCDHLSKARTPQLEELWLKEGMLLISCAGACGLVKMITKEYEDKGAIGSPDIIRLISNDELCTTEYLYVYLQLQHVYDFMQSLKYGSVIERFDIGNVKNIPIVIPSKELSEEITAIVRQYMDCTYRAFNAEEKAIRMVEQEIEKWNKH